VAPGDNGKSRGILVSRLPAALVDPVARLQRRLTIPDLTRYGIPLPQDGLLARVRRVGEVPLQGAISPSTRGGWRPR
jgi:putative flavoprotein involved in K+ transport